LNKNIAILVGGESVERTISIKSGENFFENLDTKKYSGYLILVNNLDDDFYCLKDQIKIDKSDFSLEKNGEKIQFDATVILIHGAPGETGELCSYFESLNIPYSSSNLIASKLTFDKKKCNDYLKNKGFTVPNSKINEKLNTNIKYPCIVKPINSGSSFGVSKVNSQSKLNGAIKLAKKYATNYIIEEFIDGRELTCAVHNFSKEKLITLPLTEIISHNEIFDYDAKYLGQSNEITPANLEEKVTVKIKNIATKAYELLKLNGIVRFDFIVKKGKPYIIEVNTIPGFSKESIVPQMIKKSETNIKDFISTAVDKIISYKEI
jgi:D-alanine-D-alanine ligase